MAAAGLWTTPSDLALYAIEIQGSLTGKADHVISRAMARKMLKPGLGGWGLGLQIGGAPDKPYFMHGGANEGFRNDLVAYNKRDWVVIMTNGDNGGQLAREILATIAYEYGPILNPQNGLKKSGQAIPLRLSYWGQVSLDFFRPASIPCLTQIQGTDPASDPSKIPNPYANPRCEPHGARPGVYFEPKKYILTVYTIQGAPK